MRLALLVTFCGLAAAQDRPFHQAEFVFPLEKWHNHASTIVELPGGDLFVCWYHGSGERQADDVKVEGARLPRGAKKWSERITLADTPDFPDTNPTMFVDSRERLWLLWNVILANEWHTALMKYRISSDYSKAPRWAVNETMLFVPRNFQAKVKDTLEPQLRAAEPGSRAAVRSKANIDHAAD